MSVQIGEQSIKKHEVWIEENGLISISFDSVIGHDDLVGLIDRLDDAISEQRSLGKTVKVVADVLALKHIKLEARKYGVSWLKKRKYDRLAVIYKSVYIKHFVQMLIVASSLGNWMKVFDSKDDALKWLLTD